MIVWEEGLQVTDRVVIVGVEDITSFFDDSLNISSSLEFNECGNIFELSTNSRRCGVLAKIGDESLGCSKELDGVLNARCE